MGNWENKKQQPSKNQENIRNFHQDLTPFLIERECVYQSHLKKNNNKGYILPKIRFAPQNATYFVTDKKYKLEFP